jgi:hypothetical protein
MHAPEGAHMKWFRTSSSRNEKQGGPTPPFPTRALLIGFCIFVAIFGPSLLEFWKPLPDQTLGGVSTALMGLVAIFIGLVESNFHWEGGGPMPTVLGKLMFMGIGLFFLVIGIGALLGAVELKSEN